MESPRCMAGIKSTTPSEVRVLVTYLPQLLVLGYCTDVQAWLATKPTTLKKSQCLLTVSHRVIIIPWLSLVGVNPHVSVQVPRLGKA